MGRKATETDAALAKVRTVRIHSPNPVGSVARR